MTTTYPFREALRAYRNTAASVILFSAAINLLMFVSPLYMLQVYDRVLRGKSETTLGLLTGLAVAMLIVYALLEWARSRILVRAGMRFDNVLSSPLFSRIVSATLSMPGAKSEFALADIDRLREFLTGSGLITLCDLPWAPVFIAVCFVFHPDLGWLATGGAAILLSLAIANEMVTKKPLERASLSSQQAQQFATNTLQNVEVIRALGMESTLRSRWSILHADTLRLHAKASDWNGILVGTSKFVRMVLQTFVLGLGAYLVLANEMTSGMMIACSIIVGRALGPVDQLVGQWKQFVGARQAYRRLNNLFTRIPGDDVQPGLPRPMGAFSAEQLSVGAPGSRSPIISDVTFSLMPGETLALIGPSGAGKSTLIRALIGVWTPLEGTVRLDDFELDRWNREELGDYIGYLPQTVELFAGTISENIARFKDVDSEEIILAAKRAGVHEVIQGLPDGYETQIGIGGSKLSGGQRQRIGLARALFADPAIIVLDEPNANLDMKGEEALLRALNDLRARKRTVIFVSHKMGLLALSDKSLVIADGRMRAFGPTRELLPPQKAIAPVVSMEGGGRIALNQ